jgi:hypothetical protein
VRISVVCVRRIAALGGTKWHWLATFEKVFIPDLQGDKRFGVLFRNGLVQPATAGCAGGTKWQLLATFWVGPHHRSPRSETISDSGPIRVGTLSTADRCAGGTQWHLWATFQAWFQTGVVRVTVRTASRKQDVANQWLKMAQNGSLWRGLECHLPRPGGDPERGISGGFCLSPSQLPAWDRGCRIAALTGALTRRMCVRRARGPSVITLRREADSSKGGFRFEGRPVFFEGRTSAARPPFEESASLRAGRRYDRKRSTEARVGSNGNLHGAGVIVRTSHAWIGTRRRRMRKHPVRAQPNGEWVRPAFPHLVKRVGVRGDSLWRPARSLSICMSKIGRSMMH